MLDFVCPWCKAQCQVADAYVGKTVVCLTCAKTATMPASAGAISALTPLTLPPLTAVTTPEIAEAAQQAKSRWHDDDGQRDTFSIAKDGGAPWTWIHLGVYSFVGLIVLAVIVALLLPATERVREAAARTQSVNNLKQITLAMHGFHDANKRLPFNGTGPAIGGDAKSGSWAFQLLPYIDQGPMFDNPQRHIGIATFMCPGRARPILENGGGAWTDYFYNNYLNNPKQASKPNNPDANRKMIDITDGTSSTIFVGHGNIRTDQYAVNANVTLSTNIFLGGTTGTMRSGNNGVSNPAGVTLQPDSDQAPAIGSWGGPFPQGALMGMADGTVRMFPYSMQNLGPFLTPNGGEAVTLPDT